MAKNEDLNEDLDEELEDEEVENEDVEDEDLDEDSDPDGDEDEDEEPASESKKQTDKSAKRIRDLQSAKDKAEAELKRLKRELASGKDRREKRELDPEVQQWMEVAKDTTRQRLFEADPRLKDSGLTAAAITGDTPDEMRRSARALTKMLDKVETRTRNRLLQEHGIEPSQSDAGRPPARDYASMSKEEFERIVAEARGM